MCLNPSPVEISTSDAQRLGDPATAHPWQSPSQQICVVGAMVAGPDIGRCLVQKDEVHS